MKRINITTGVLLVYLLVMCVWGWPGKQPDPDWVQYFRSWSFPVRYLPTALSAGQTYEDAEKVERRERDKIK